MTPFKKHDPVTLLGIRNFIENQLIKHSDIESGGGAGVFMDGSGAVVDILIKGHLFNIRIQPRGE